MKVWIVQTGEPLPLDPGHPRLLRSGILADRLAEKGHDVTWWAADFSHRAKTHRRLPEERVPVSPRLAIIPLRSPGYQRNVSLQRIRDHHILGQRFAALAEGEDRPDVIHCGFPPIEIAREAVRYGVRHDVPVVMDCRDLWPDIFLDALPAVVRPMARLAIRPAFTATRDAFRLATAVSGHAPGFVAFGLHYAGRPAGVLDRHFPFGYHSSPPTDAQVDEATQFWARMGVIPETGVSIVCAFGTYGEQRALDLETPIHAARILAAQGAPIRFVLCGDGPRLTACRRLAEGLSNLVMPGWLEYPHIWTLMRMSRLGLLPYLPSRDFAMSVPNKVIEYLSAGLPIATSLTEGYLHDLLSGHDCGLFYPGRDPEALATTLTSSLETPGLVAGMSSRAGDLYRSSFEADTVYGAMVDHLESVARHGRNRTRAIVRPGETQP